MVRTIEAPNAEARFSDLIDSVEASNEAIIVEREGRPIAVVINPAAYERFLRLESERNWTIIDRIRERNADLDPDEVYADVTAEVAAVRQAKREARARRG
jgi:prevent-host-death family protein